MVDREAGLDENDFISSGSNFEPEESADDEEPEDMDVDPDEVTRKTTTKNTAEKKKKKGVLMREEVNNVRAAGLEGTFVATTPEANKRKAEPG